MSETVERTTLALDAGDVRGGRNPIMEVVPGPGGTYLWVGDDDMCFGSLGPSKRELRRLRDALNVALGDA